MKRVFILFSKHSNGVSVSKESRHTTFSESSRVRPVSHELRFPRLKTQIDRLAKRAWESRESLGAELLLNSSHLPVGATEKTVEAILNHVRRIAPGLSVPHRVPRIITGALVDAAGQFKVSDGWVTVKLATHLLMDRKAVRAILAHEACHYILENSGIRDTNYEQNERLTDLCMFVCGLGGLFLEGYKRESPQNEYRQGHRLGYLTDAEYEFAAKYVLELRSNNSLPLPTRTEELERTFAVRVTDSQIRDRLIKHARARYPEKSDLQLYELVIEQLERDRR